MTKGLVRYQQAGDLHFITFSCYGRKPYLASPAARELFEASLEKMRRKYGFAVLGYVVMPEHVHLLVNEPALCLLSRALQALKISVSVQRSERPFWLRRYYDFNVHSAERSPKSCGTCTATPWPGGWSRSRRTGSGRAFAITPLELRERSKSSRSGQRRSGEDVR
jgi:putative transposase